jgi:hypothetical protein
MKFRGEFLGQPSGSLGGVTFSHNKGGYYTRTRAVPTNPNTALQSAVRAALGQLASRWGTTLTDAYRDAWNIYASNVPVLNSLGETINLTGQQMFIRSNVPRIQAGLTIIDAGPTTFNLGEFTQPSIDSAGSISQEVDITFDVGDEWVDEDGAYMLLYCGKPIGQGRKFYKGPFRLMGNIAGNSVTPETSPQTFTPPYTISEGNLLWVRATVIRADGRLSLSTIIGPELIIGA